MTPVTPLTYVDALTFEVTQPFNFRHTLWKPSHFATDLEVHTVDESWRSFRIGDLRCGVHAHMGSPTQLVAEVYADGDWTQHDRDHLAAQIRNAYGLTEDLAPFVALCADVPAMRQPLAVLAGMRHSCPENLFEIAIIALLLQNATINRTMQMTRNLLSHYGSLVHFARTTLRCFFTPQGISAVSEEEFRLKDRLGYRAKFIGRYAEFFTIHAETLADATVPELITEFQKIKGVGPYTAAIIASHASRDPSALGLDVWNRKLLARHLLGLDDSTPEAVTAACTATFPGYQAIGALYLIEHDYLHQPVAPLVTRADLPAWNDRLAVGA